MLKGLSFIILLLWSVLLLCWVGFIPGILLLPLNWKLYRDYLDGFLGTMWFSLAVFLLEFWCGIKVVFRGERVPQERATIISNHRTRIDWMFLWILCDRLGFLPSMKFALKAGLRKLPGFGWGCQFLSFMFLERNWGKDQDRVSQQLEMFGKTLQPFTLVFFPEGSDLSDSNLEKSAAFAKKEGLQVTKYVLQPRITGLAHVLKKQREMKTVDAVYDITMGYVDHVPGERPSEMSMLKGRFPKEVHFFLSRYPIGNIPTDEEGVTDWTRKVFYEKEERLRKFYEEDSNQFTEGEELFATYKPGFLKFVAGLWVLASLIYIYQLIYSWVAIYYSIICVLILYGITSSAVGMDRIEMDFMHPLRCGGKGPVKNVMHGGTKSKKQG